MSTLELFERLSVALAIGLLIGLERGWTTRDEAEGERSAGLRTLALSGLLGGVWGAIAQIKGDGGTIALAIAFATYAGAMTLFRYRETAFEGTRGATTLVAALLTFALGAFAVLGDMAIAAAGGVATATLLALKSILHGWVRRLTWVELRSALVLATMTFILLPLLPKRTIDPWGTINPFELWLMTILIAAISFVGYVAMKAAGDRQGSLLTGFAGGLVSSTAVTVTLARLAQAHPRATNSLLSGILVSYATMMTRVLAVVSVANVALLGRLAAPIGLAGAAMAALAFLYYRRPSEAGESVALDLKNPVDFSTVLQFGALLTAITVLSKVLTQVAGNAGAYGLAAVSGLADVDAITLSMARLGTGDLGADVAAHAIGLVVLVNTLAKVVLGWMTGGSRIGLHLLGAAVVAVAAGIAGAQIIPAP